MADCFSDVLFPHMLQTGKTDFGMLYLPRPVTTPSSFKQANSSRDPMAPPTNLTPLYSACYCL